MNVPENHINLYIVSSSFIDKPPTELMPRDCGSSRGWMARVVETLGSMKSNETDQKKFAERFIGHIDHKRDKTGFAIRPEQIETFGFSNLPESRSSDNDWRAKIKQIQLAVAIPLIKSISFIPSHPETYQTLFIEKTAPSLIPTHDGYIQAYRSFPDSVAHQLEEYPFERVTTPADVAASIGSDSEQIKTAIKPILDAFLTDSESTTLALSFTDGTTRVWSKQ